jgi:hypothetical protein
MYVYEWASLQPAPHVRSAASGEHGQGGPARAPA